MCVRVRVRVRVHELRVYNWRVRLRVRVLVLTFERTPFSQNELSTPECETMVWCVRLSP